MEVGGELVGGDDGAVDAAVNEVFGFAGEAIEVFEVDLLADEDKLYGVGVATHGHVAGDVGLGYVSDAFEDVLDELVDSGVLTEECVEVAKERVTAVGAVDFPVLLHTGYQESSLLETVEFEADGVGAFTELVGQSAKMSTEVGGEEETGEELEAGFAGNQEVEQLGFKVLGLNKLWLRPFGHRGCAIK